MTPATMITASDITITSRRFSLDDDSAPYSPSAMAASLDEQAPRERTRRVEAGSAYSVSSRLDPEAEADGDAEGDQGVSLVDLDHGHAAADGPGQRHRPMEEAEPRSKRGVGALALDECRQVDHAVGDQEEHGDHLGHGVEVACPDHRHGDHDACRLRCVFRLQDPVAQHDILGLVKAR